MKFSRIEAMGRADNVEEGVAARLADPLWMLGRQWQLGELTGDDSSQPATVRVVLNQAPLISYRPEGDLQDPDDPPDAVPLSPTTPLEAVVEAAPRPRSGSAGLHDAVVEGQRLARLLDDAATGQASRLLRAAFSPPTPASDEARLPSVTAAAGALLRRRGLDAHQVLASSVERLEYVLGSLNEPHRTTALEVIATWGATQAPQGPSPWLSAQLEHRFSVAADDHGADVVLRAGEHQGGRVDWHSFDLDPDDEHIFVDPEARTAERTTLNAIATPVRFAGMPASRWWEFEDGNVNLGDLDVGPGDLARLAVAEFAAVYNNDWFVVPARIKRATLARIEQIQVIDTFGIPHEIRPASVVDHDRAIAIHGEDQAADLRVWRFFELTGDTHVDDGMAPWLLVPPSLASTLHGPPLERIVLARDEDANLAWAIERLIEGPLGRAVDRGSTWSGWTSDSPRASAEPSTSASDGEPLRYGDMHWRYDLETSPPPWWIPLVPERLHDQTEETRLRRARMATWIEHEPADVGPKGTLLEPDRAFYLHEEEVPRSGATVSRSWQWARWEDGSTHLWLQRRKQNGRGERSSGLAWDVLHDVAGSAPELPPNL